MKECLMLSSDKEFFTLEEVAELLCVNYQLVYKLVKTGEMPALRIGRVYRVRKSQLEKFINDNSK